MTEIRPALTPEEWRDMDIEAGYGISRTSVHVDHKGRIFVHGQMPGEDEKVIIVNESDDSTPHKIAALCLRGRAFGFDTEDDELNCPAASIVEALRNTADAIDDACGTKMIGVVRVQGPAGSFTIGAYYASMFRACAARIAALLPPP